MIKFIASGYIGDVSDRQIGENYCLTINVSSKEKRKVGEEWKDAYEHLRITYWTKSEKIVSMLKSAERITALGRQQTDVVDKDGTKTYYTKYIADEIEFSGEKRNGTQSQRPF